MVLHKKSSIYLHYEVRSACHCASIDVIIFPRETNHHIDDSYSSILIIDIMKLVFVEGNF
ncbi:CLUMA_CG019397, isoform A [Clunio marinus]|uniref:CLUMA_CG019397, isoform A n=1 Tax=Clunio marinus TaxID=568069 RepID=A0A1J1J3B8_9DIPT|nr:CLUMA_CG019397, isoform A [Clunio marinus]